MIFFDTSVIIHSIITQDEIKQKCAQSIISHNLQNNSFRISTLILSELIFVLGKLKLSEKEIKIHTATYQNKYVCKSLEYNICNSAFELCLKLKTCKNINDAIHLKFAEKYCDKLITFDSDFKKFIPHTNLEIEILQ